LDFLGKAWKGGKAPKEKNAFSKELWESKTWTTSKAMKKCMCIRRRGKLQQVVPSNAPKA
jgi:hypothetical protein